MSESPVDFPAKLCRLCGHPTSDCDCETAQCLWCLGEQQTTTCSKCDGEGVTRPDRVSVIPDRDAFRIREYLRETPDLRKGRYTEADMDPLEGLCYPASEAYYHVTGKHLDVYCLSWDDVDPSLDGTHWYLRDPDSGEFIDIGLPFTQVTDLPPFEVGRRRGFMTGNTPSKRTEMVLEDLGFK